MSNLSSSSSTVTAPRSNLTVTPSHPSALAPRSPSPDKPSSRIPVTPAVLRNIFASSRTILEERSLSRVAFFRYPFVFFAALFHSNLNTLLLQFYRIFAELLGYQPHCCQRESDQERCCSSRSGCGLEESFIGRHLVLDLDYNCIWKKEFPTSSCTTSIHIISHHSTIFVFLVFSAESLRVRRVVDRK